MYDSTLPQYVLDRVTAPIGMLRSPTVFWAHNGFFGGWEGTGCCTGMPTHVWQYAQSGPRLWPDISRRWLDQWFAAQQGDGTIPYRYTVPTYSTDGQTGVVLTRGDRVQVLSGALAEFIGRFDCASDEERVFVLLELLGRQVRVRVPSDSLAAATA